MKTSALAKAAASKARSATTEGSAGRAQRHPAGSRRLAAHQTLAKPTNKAADRHAASRLERLFKSSAPAAATAAHNKA